MKRLFLFFFTVPSIACAQLYVDFESGIPPGWDQSRDSAWKTTGTEPLCGDFSLWHAVDDSVSGEDRISFAYDSLVMTDSVSTSWQFALHHAYLPSSTNKWAVFLLSDMDEKQMKPGGNLESVVLGVNFTGSDDLLKLWGTREGKIRVIATTELNWQESIGTGEALLRVSREPGGIWMLELGSGPGAPCTGDVVWKQIGSGEDTALLKPGYFGLYYHFSSKQDRKFWFDGLRVSGLFIRDTVPPGIESYSLPDEHTIRIRFSENLDQRSVLRTDRYLVLPGGRAADSVILLNGNTLDLYYSSSFPRGERQILRILEVGDLKGNVSGILELEFTWYRAGPGDVIFNEVMYDPFPEVHLPGYEYIELINRCEFPLELGKWILQTGERRIVLPDFRFPPGEILLLCYTGTPALYPLAEHALDVLTTKTLLPNEGTALSLLDRDSLLIDRMEYSPGMHRDEYFTGGGWSLERIDPERICYAEDNWTSSGDMAGGTPGRVNSVQGTNPDGTPPEILSVSPRDPYKILVEFSEAMDLQSVTKPDAWFISGSMGSPDSAGLKSPRNRDLTLYYSEGLVPGREYYLENRARVKDCPGNTLLEGTEIRFAMPVAPERSSVFISEILFNPWPYCPDFIELYNGGRLVFDLADLRLANRDPENGSIVSAARTTGGHRLFFPGDYLVVTEDPDKLENYYTVEDRACLVEAPDMPQMGDKEGSILVLDSRLCVLEEMRYDRDMHHPLLESDEGVSLERISFDSGAGNRSNWHSASSSEGWATPGRKNSQFHEALADQEGFEIDPKIFTPDMDGIDDVLMIRYRFDSPGLSARILVVDPRGRLVKEIASRELLGTAGFFTWDGFDRSGHRARTGIYLVIAEVGGLQGDMKRYRKTCILATGR